MKNYLDIKGKKEEKKGFDEEDVIKLMEDWDLKRVIKWMRNKFGKKAFTPYFFHSAEIVSFKDKGGNEL